MTEIWKRVYKDNIVGILKELADKEYQAQVWLNLGRKPVMTISFIEAACMLFDDSAVGDYLKEGEILFDEKTTLALRELDEAVSAIDDNRRQDEVIDDPLMQVVREKAARALYLIQVSTYEGSTVDIAIPGQSYPGEVVR